MVQHPPASQSSAPAHARISCVPAAPTACVSAPLCIGAPATHAVCAHGRSACARAGRRTPHATGTHAALSDARLVRPHLSRVPPQPTLRAPTGTVYAPTGTVYAPTVRPPALPVRCPRHPRRAPTSHSGCAHRRCARPRRTPTAHLRVPTPRSRCVHSALRAPHSAPLVRTAISASV
jgi:hypothetical protein